MPRQDKERDTKQHSNGILFDKSLGQHILKNPLVIKSIIEKSNLKPSDHVLEIGPGTGNVTTKILEVVRKTTVVEMDPRMAAELQKRVQGTAMQHKLHLIVGDFLKVGLPKFDVCISNTPYQISSSLIFKLLMNPGWRVAVLMFQREFAARLVARVGEANYCRLTANVSLLATVKMVMKVGRNNFRPPPQVESAVVRVESRYPKINVDFDEWDGLLRILFVRKNKTVAGNFKTKSVLEMLEANYRTIASLEDRIVDDSFSVSVEVARVLSDSGMCDSRASKMDTDDFLKLLLAFMDAGFRFTSK